MAMRRTLIKAKAAVRLERIEQLRAQGRVSQRHFKLSTLRANQPRVLASEDDAEEAFHIEVMASLVDPAVARLIRRKRP